MFFLVGRFIGAGLLKKFSANKVEFADDLLGGYLNLEGGNPKARFKDLENAAGSLKCISSETCLMVVFDF